MPARGRAEEIGKSEIYRMTELWSELNSFMDVKVIVWCGNLIRAKSRLSEAVMVSGREVCGD